MSQIQKMLRTLYWKNNKLYILNQKLLPSKIYYVECKRYCDVADAIKNMIIRGAPAIGIAGAFAMVIASIEKKLRNIGELEKYLLYAKKRLSDTRPTAVNLIWALNELMNTFEIYKNQGIEKIQNFLLKKAKNILLEDIEMNKKISKYGTDLIKKYSYILTHCNAGSLATGGQGTALGIIYEAHKQKKIKMVYVDETRPYLQGARLTAFELKYNKVPATLICDNMAGYIMKTKKISAVIVGADRISVNGDVANKIGTYSLAILAKYHKVNFYVAAPYSSIDFKIKSGKEILIEQRPAQEITEFLNKKIILNNLIICNPGFDVTPNTLITAIITEKGIIYPPFSKNIQKLYT